MSLDTLPCLHRKKKKRETETLILFYSKKKKKQKGIVGENIIHLNVRRKGIIHPEIFQVKSEKIDLYVQSPSTLLFSRRNDSAVLAIK